MEIGEFQAQPLIDELNPNDPYEIYPSADVYLSELSGVAESVGDFDMSDDDEDEPYSHQESHPVDEMYLVERIADIRAELDKLPEREREVFLSRAVEGKSYARVGEEMERSASWTQMLYYQARARLQNLHHRTPWDLKSYFNDLDSL